MSPWRSILEVALRAPSLLNTQPWRVRLLDDAGAEVHLEGERALPRLDEAGRLLAVSMGLLVESVRLIAANHGFDLDEESAYPMAKLTAEDVERMPGDPVRVASLALRPGADASPYPDELFLARRTSRLAYAPEPVGLQDARGLGAVAEEWGQRYVQSSNPERVERLLSWNIDAVLEDLDHESHRNEMRRWLRYTERQSRARRDGLDARCLNLQPLELWLAFHASWLLLWPPGARLVRSRLGEQIGPVATMGVLAGACSGEDAYRAGRFLIHFWLECTKRGLSIHPLSNLVTNRAAATRCEREWRVPDIWLEFRIGRSPEAPQSRRRALDDVLI